MKPTPEQLLEVARDLLGRFVQVVQAKFPASRPEPNWLRAPTTQGGSWWRASCSAVVAEVEALVTRKKEKSSP